MSSLPLLALLSRQTWPAWAIATILGIYAGIIAVGMAASDVFINEKATHHSEIYVASQLFYRYAGGILGAFVGWAVGRLSGVPFSLPMVGALTLFIVGVIAGLPSGQPEQVACGLPPEEDESLLSVASARWLRWIGL